MPGLLAALFVGALPASADSIYDAKVEQKLTDLNPDQKAKPAITKQTASEMNAVFKKYGIDPDATPNFDQLQKAAMRSPRRLRGARKPR